MTNSKIKVLKQSTIWNFNYIMIKLMPLEYVFITLLLYKANVHPFQMSTSHMCNVEYNPTADYTWCTDTDHIVGLDHNFSLTDCLESSLNKNIQNFTIKLKEYPPTIYWWVMFTAVFKNVPKKVNCASLFIITSLPALI